jgi:hypothetical protein
MRTHLAAFHRHLVGIGTPVVVAGLVWAIAIVQAVIIVLSVVYLVAGRYAGVWICILAFVITEALRIIVRKAAGLPRVPRRRSRRQGDHSISER